MKILIVAEHDNKDLKPSTLSCITAAKQIDTNIELLILGFNCDGVIQNASKISGLKKIKFIDNEDFKHQIAEDLTQPIMNIVKDAKYTHVMSPSGTFGKNLLPRISALLDVQQISDITEVIDHETFERPIYAGNAMLKVKSTDKIKVVTVRGTCFEQALLDGNVDVEEIKFATNNSEKVKFLKHELSESDRPELTSAKIVISGGRGMQNGDNFKLLEGIADKLGAAVGASRAAVDAGFVPNDWQVGQTGKIVAPDLYIAVGISGAIQHIAGIKDSKFIVAINKDEEAPIFNFSDYGLVGDLFEVLPKLEEKL